MLAINHHYEPIPDNRYSSMHVIENANAAASCGGVTVPLASQLRVNFKIISNVHGAARVFVILIAGVGTNHPVYYIFIASSATRNFLHSFDLR